MHPMRETKMMSFLASATKLQVIAALAPLLAIHGAQALWMGGGVTILTNNLLDGNSPLIYHS